MSSSLTVVDGTELVLEVVETDNGVRAVLLTVSNEHGSEVEMLLPVPEAREVGLDLMVLAREAQEADGEAAEDFGDAGLPPAVEMPEYLLAPSTIADAHDIGMSYAEMCVAITSHKDWTWKKNLGSDSLRKIRRRDEYAISNQRKLAVIARTLRAAIEERIGGNA